MITIGPISINPTAGEIAVEVVTSNGNVFTGMTVWDAYTYKDYASGVDLSSLLSGTTNAENLTIAASDMGVPEFTGIYFIEFTTDEPEENTKTAVVANLASYYNCLYTNLDKLSIKNCGKPVADDCGRKSTEEYVYYVAALIQSLGHQVMLGDFKKAAKIALKLEKSCGGCCNKTDTEFTTEAYSWGTGTSLAIPSMTYVDSNGDPVNVVISGEIVTITDLPCEECEECEPCEGVLVTVTNSEGHPLIDPTIVGPGPGTHPIVIGDSIVTLEDGDENFLSSTNVPAGKPATIYAPNATVILGDNTLSVLAGGTLPLNVVSKTGDPVPYTVQGNSIIV